MEWKLFTQLAVTLVVAVFGGWLGHLFAARRDLANERRKLLIQYLVEAYRKLEGASERTQDRQRYQADLESAIADIQFLGSANQAALAQRFANDMSQKSAASTMSLLFDLRRSLRDELRPPRYSKRSFSCASLRKMVQISRHPHLDCRNVRMSRRSAAPPLRYDTGPLSGLSHFRYLCPSALLHAATSR